jgi:hypothetical protein
MERLPDIGISSFTAGQDDGATNLTAIRYYRGRIGIISFGTSVIDGHTYIIGREICLHLRVNVPHRIEMVKAVIDATGQKPVQ